MTIGDTPVAPAKLDFGAAFSATFGIAFGRLWSFVKAALLPVALSILILLAFAGFALVAGGEPPSVLNLVLYLALEIVGQLPLVIFGIACSRLVLLGRQAGAIPRPLFGRRTLVYLGYTLLMVIVMSLPMIAFGIAMFGTAIFTMGTEPDPAQMERMAGFALAVPLLFLFYLVYLYFVTRLSLVFPAVAVDRKLGLAGSWRLTRGACGFKLYALLIVIVLLWMVCTLVVMLIVNSLVALLWFTPDVPAQPGDIDWVMVAVSAAPSAIIGLLAQFLGFVLVAAAVSVTYAQLSGWGAPSEEILERFE